MSFQTDSELETILISLKRKGFDARFAKNRLAARKIVADLVPQNSIVGCGDSTTVRSIGVLQDLVDAGNMILNPFFKPKILRRNPAPLPMSVMKQIQGCKVFIASANAVTLDGKIVSIDGGGMRAAGMFFGPLLTILVIGRNKIVKDVDEALYRIKNVIAPAHAKTIGADWGIPCVTAGKCVEPEAVCGEDGQIRLCNVLVILEGRPPLPDTHTVVIVVDEDLGLGWDPTWPKERIDKIYAEYKEFTPPHRRSAGAKR